MWQFIVLKIQPNTLYSIMTRKNSKTSVTFVLYKQKSTCGLLTHSVGMLKAKATTETFFMIGQVILLINDQLISPCNSFLVHPISSKSTCVNRAYIDSCW